jgi:hypothetical protein
MQLSDQAEHEIERRVAKRLLNWLRRLAHQGCAMGGIDKR